MSRKEINRLVDQICKEALARLEKTGTPPFPAYFAKAFRDVAESRSDEYAAEVRAQLATMETEERTSRVLDETVNLARNSISAYSDSTTKVKEIAGEQEAILDLDGLEASGGDGVKILKEVKACQESLSSELRVAEAKIADLEKVLAKSESDAFIDPLTKLMTEPMLDHQLESILKVGDDRDLDLYVMEVEVDDFEAVKEEFGYVVGEKILIFLSKSLQNSIRSENRIYRKGASTFIVVLNRSDHQEAVMVAGRVKQRVEASKLVYAEKIINITVSVGLARHRAGDDGAALKERASQLLQTASRQGGSTVLDG